MVLALVFGLFLGCRSAPGQIDAGKYRADLTAICGFGSRVVGSPGYYAAGKYLEEQISELPNVELKKHEYAVMTPVTESATLTLSGGSVENVYPFWPAQIRTCSTPVEG